MVFLFNLCLSSYIDELSKQLKKEFLLASPTKKDGSVERDDVVHIYYKVWMKAEIFLLNERSRGCKWRFLDRNLCKKWLCSVVLSQ